MIPHWTTAHIFPLGWLKPPSKKPMFQCSYKLSDRHLPQATHSNPPPTPSNRSNCGCPRSWLRITEKCHGCLRAHAESGNDWFHRVQMKKSLNNDSYLTTCTGGYISRKTGWKRNSQHFFAETQAHLGFAKTKR